MYEKYINSITRRDFVKEVAAGTAAVAAVGAGAITSEAAPQPEIFSLDKPVGNQYSQYLFTGLKDQLSAMIPAFGAPAPYFRGAWQIPGASINIGWQVVTKPNFMEKEGHHHLVDEYFCFFGAQLPDIWSSFDAEIELCLGPDEEMHIIKEPTFVFIPKGLHHNPCNFKVVNKPLLFQAIHLGPRFHKIMNGKEYWFEGPGRDASGWKGHPW
jgi:hypothetical protein